MSGSGTTDETDPRIGMLVGGKYRVREVIGRGGMGVVYRGTDEDLGGPVAVKFLHRVFTSDPDLRERFRREAQALARLRHQGIVSLLHFGTHDDETFMVMELVSGSVLSKLIEGGTLPLPMIAAVFDELLSVLEAAHAAGIVHRDIKPSNVIVLPGDRAKLLDFGLVHLPDSLDKLTKTGLIHGTPDYMSPEQSEGERIGPASDIYSAAVVLYECLAGERPFEGSGAVLMAQHLFVDPPPIKTRGHKRDVPAGLESLVRRALAKKPEERPSATEMRTELAAVIRGTDSVTLAPMNIEARQRDAQLSRGERALSSGPAPGPTQGAMPSAPVEIRVSDEARAAELRSALGVAGIGSRVVNRKRDVSSDVGAIIISASEGLDVVQLGLRAGVPVLVVDVRDGPTTLEAIRSGAADIVAVGMDGKVAPLILRLLRRRR